ncbi:MAG: hypothetical protein GC159_03130 [Phycisphaera sp.]|nr:hypothetical protein [Phycisphaera sp.]
MSNESPPDKMQDTAKLGPPPAIADSDGLRIRAGTLEVMGSGTIIHNLYTPLEFGLPASPPLTCRLVFRRDYDDSTPRIKHDLEDRTTVVLTLINMGTRLGSGPRHPVQVATIRNRPVSIQFVLRILNESNNIGIFDYTWFMDMHMNSDQPWAPLDTTTAPDAPMEEDPSATAQVDLTETVRADRAAAEEAQRGADGDGEH